MPASRHHSLCFCPTKTNRNFCVRDKASWTRCVSRMSISGPKMEQHWALTRLLDLTTQSWCSQLRNTRLPSNNLGASDYKQCMEIPSQPPSRDSSSTWTRLRPSTSNWSTQSKTYSYKLSICSRCTRSARQTRSRNGQRLSPNCTNNTCKTKSGTRNTWNRPSRTRSRNTKCRWETWFKTMTL